MLLSRKHAVQSLSAMPFSNDIHLVCARPIYRKRSLLEQVTEGVQCCCNTRATSAALRPLPNMIATTSVRSEVLSMEIRVNYASST